MHIPHINNTILLYSALRYYKSYAWRRNFVPQWSAVFYELLSSREGLYPLSEMTYAFHDNVHVIQSIPEIGPPSYNNLYKFERTNLVLKRLCKNKNHPIASIVKNYLTAECNFQHLVGNLSTVDKIASGFQYSPCMMESEFFKSFQDLHITYGLNRKKPVMMYIPMASVIEIRGRSFDYELSSQQQNYLLFALGYWSAEGTLISTLWVSYCENHLKISPKKNVLVYFREFLQMWPNRSDPPYRELNEEAYAKFSQDKTIIVKGLPTILKYVIRILNIIYHNISLGLMMRR